MTKHIPPVRTLRFAVTGVPEGITEEAMRKIVEAAVGEFGAAALAVAAPKPAAKRRSKPIKRTPLYNRTTRTAGKYQCRVMPTALHAKSVMWPIGAPHQGCGRVYTNANRRDIHESGKGWNPKVFPNGCLDRILPMSMRDTR